MVGVVGGERAFGDGEDAGLLVGGKFEFGAGFEGHAAEVEVLTVGEDRGGVGSGDGGGHEVVFVDGFERVVTQAGSVINNELEVVEVNGLEGFGDVEGTGFA